MAHPLLEDFDIKISKPLAFFDIETTGTVIAKDRIIEISIMRLDPVGEVVTKTRRFNPGIPIPAETTAIHGITDADVVDEPPFKSVARSIVDFLKGCDLGGYNMVRFDLPFLIEELHRCNIDFEMQGRRLIDPQKIFYAMQPRTLSAAYKYYCNEHITTLGKAHNSLTDTLAAYHVFSNQVKKYEGQEHECPDGQMRIRIKRDINHLHQEFCADVVDYAGHFQMRNDIEIFAFGKHKGQPVSEVLKREPGMYDWMMKGDFPIDTKRKLTAIKLRNFNK